MHSFTAPVTDKKLLDAIKSAEARAPQTQVERFEQRVSYVFGAIGSNSGVTREQVREIVLKQQGDGS